MQKALKVAYGVWKLRKEIITCVKYWNQDTFKVTAVTCIFSIYFSIGAETYETTNICLLPA